jgi:HD-GYP domain-containing protein (c-di-GMP phosphodiesterase class II)
MAIADSYDAMTTTRPYRVPLPKEAVMQELIENRGKQFDPYLTESFLRLLDATTLQRGPQSVTCPPEL